MKASWYCDNTNRIDIYESTSFKKHCYGESFGVKRVYMERRGNGHIVETMEGEALKVFTGLHLPVSLSARGTRRCGVYGKQVKIGGWKRWGFYTKGGWLGPEGAAVFQGAAPVCRVGLCSGSRPDSP